MTYWLGSRRLEGVVISVSVGTSYTTQTLRTEQHRLRAAWPADDGTYVHLNRAAHNAGYGRRSGSDGVSYPSIVS